MTDPTRAALEAAARANPDDATAARALADYLLERADPLGEFMRVQLALEDESLPKPERDALKAREAELLAAHRRYWLGELADLPTDPRKGESWYPKEPAKWAFRRGRPHRLDLWIVLAEDIARLARAPEGRWLEELAVEGVGDGDEEEDASLAPLAAAPFAPTLRRLEIGESQYNTHTRADGLTPFVAACRRLEVLQVMAHGVDSLPLVGLLPPTLREFGLHCVTAFPLHQLCRNPNLAGLRRLELTPHAVEIGDEGPYLDLDGLRLIAGCRHFGDLSALAYRGSDAGDAGCTLLVESGLLFRLTELSLDGGTITDAGARTLAEGLRYHEHRLKVLNLDYNELTADGIEALRSAGVEVRADHQHAPGDGVWMFVGDME